ncbi:GNAT family N-acetyltransferase [Anaeromyxobacter sp. Red801]|uniref:GNAT family N-acetyltransferase n=1 Tax=Anaeromyxobacter sp. Red801 TaxID=3411632 RepID=UPI003BA2334D
MSADLLREQLELRRVGPDLEAALAELFSALVAAGDDRSFHPHPFTPEAAAERARYAGLDVYCAAVVAGRVLGYGMLRGWDEGYAVPSLGIAIHPAARGLGLGRLVMEYLHCEARRRGAPRIRLKVYPANAAAVALYRSLGYEFQGEERGQLVGYKALPARP